MAHNLKLYGMADTALRLMVAVGSELADTGYDPPSMGWAMYQAFAAVFQESTFEGVHMQAEAGKHVSLQEWYTASLSGWISTKISLKRNKRLNAILAEDGGRPSEKLRRELPAATVVEWAGLRPEDDLKVLVRNVVGHLEKQGSESAKLARRGKLAGTQLDVGVVGQGTNEPDLEEFVLREQLRAIRSSTKLSKRENEVLDLLLQNYTEREAAGKLKIT